MFSRTSLTSRATRALIAPLTVWCLGCSGFEPMVDALMGNAPGSGMVCGTSDRGEDDTATMATAASPQAAGPGVVSVGAAAHRGFDCGCGQSCHGVSVIDRRDAPRMSPPPRVATVDAPQPSSVARTPLVPPPQRTA